jgi:thioredoxin reductase (NADPH)
MASPLSPVLSASQIATLREHGEERTAAVGDVLFRVGDHRYPFIVILEGEAAVIDAAGNEVVRHGPAGFIGEVNLLSGQTVFLTAVATRAMRYVAIDRDELRSLLFDNGALADIVLSSFVARREALQLADVGLEVIGPSSSEATRRMAEYARRNRLAFAWRDPEHSEDPEAEALIAGLDAHELPLVRLPGGQEMRNPSAGQLSRALGIGSELAAREDVDLLVIGGGPAGLAAAVYGASEGLDTLLVEGTALGGQAGTSRRIENYLGFPGGISGAELTSRAVSQARKFEARTATPYHALALEPGIDRHVVLLDEDRSVSARAVVLATGAEYRRLPVDDIHEYEGISVFYEAGPPEARLCGGSRVGVVGGGNSAAQAAIWLARGGALVTLMHRRTDLRETMSNYLIVDLERYGVEVRGQTEIVGLHGNLGELDGVSLKDGERLAFSYLFLFLGASPCTDWLDGVLERDKDGFVLTGQQIGAGHMLETSLPGVYAAGDARSGSVKRCATAVGEGAMVVSFIHQRLAETSTAPRVN